MDIVKPVTKKELRQEYGVSLPTFNKWIKELSKSKNCPFSYEKWKNGGNLIKGNWVKFIIENL